MRQTPPQKGRPSSTGRVPGGPGTDVTSTFAAPPGSGSGGSRGGAPTFNAGEVVAGRYRIVRFIARGGMGEVYEAEDRELCGAGRAQDDAAGHRASRGAIDRFKREIHLARKVTHPNVCRIFDLGVHHVPASEAAPPPRCASSRWSCSRARRSPSACGARGQLPPEEALPIVRQMAAALATAHEAGIVHRDFKSSNVILVPGREGDRAVVDRLRPRPRRRRRQRPRRVAHRHRKHPRHAGLHGARAGRGREVDRRPPTSTRSAWCSTRW